MEHHDRDRLLDPSMNAHGHVSSAHTFSRSPESPVIAAAMHARAPVTPPATGTRPGRADRHPQRQHR
ncbi:hypothetical protein [Nonomuraea glycinis]|uniref:hypothetical protein n=1 Tax=Nonomuraea glycinis TaxID=2047744 RepID=UPI002E163DE3|nr:hypothetical protein OHA68_24800 [Nonomuraea glycinis]